MTLCGSAAGRTISKVAVFGAWPAAATAVTPEDFCPIKILRVLLGDLLLVYGTFSYMHSKPLISHLEHSGTAKLHRVFASLHELHDFLRSDCRILVVRRPSGVRVPRSMGLRHSTAVSDFHHLTHFVHAAFSIV